MTRPRRSAVDNALVPDRGVHQTGTGSLEAEKCFRKVLGFKELWILAAALGRGHAAPTNESKKAA